MHSLLALAFWVVGSDYIGLQKNGAFTFQPFPETNSSLVDRSSCALWVTEGGRLWRFSDRKEQKGKALRILEDASVPFWIESEPGRLARIDRNGEVLEAVPLSTSSTLLSVHPIEGGWLGLHREKSTLSVVLYDPSWNVVRTISVSEGRDLFHQAEVAVFGSEFWIGFSARSAGFSYSPYLERYSLTGTKLFSKVWPARGLFTDLVLSPEGQLTFAYELPTMPYTLPIRPYLETFPENSKSAGPENRMIESMELKPLRYLERPLSTSHEGSYVNAETGEVLLAHNGIQKIFSCTIEVDVPPNSGNARSNVHLPN